MTLWRTRVLLVRSEISAVGILVAQLCNFAHPFIPRILSAALQLEGLSSELPESALVREDVDRCLSTIATKIPPRLSVPLLLQSAPAILGAGHSAASRFADLLAEVWQQLDRSTVVAHLSPLSSLATLLLDYRRVFGDQSAAAAEVDSAAADAVVELCLKLTETELRSFLTRLAEWRDVRFKPKKNADGSSGDNNSGEVDWRRYSRSVSYFSLTDALMSKLKSLFIPIMGVLWSSAVELLNSFASHAAKLGNKKVAAATVTDDDSDDDSAAKNKKNKSKKRKHADAAAEDGTAAESVQQRQLMAELELLSGYILSSVRECCQQDTHGGFIDEVRLTNCHWLFYFYYAFISIVYPPTFPCCFLDIVFSSSSPLLSSSTATLREDDACSGGPAAAAARLCQRGGLLNLL